MTTPQSPGGPDKAPEYGPRGYVPPQAAKRARKIVLREPMGLGWPVAAVAAGLLLAVLGALYLLTQTGPPSAPFQAVGELSAVDPRGADTLAASGGDVLVVRAGGGVRAYVAPPADTRYCAQSRALESAAGQVWALDGRALSAGTTSLSVVPVRVHNGTLYVDLSAAATPLPPRGDSTQPRCDAA